VRYDILPYEVLVQRAKEMRTNPTRAEHRLWSLIRRKRIGVRVRRQEVIAGFIVDFYIPSKKLAIEVDGYSHRGRGDYDAMRTSCLGHCGVTVIRLTNEEVLKTPLAAISKLREAIGE
jgi:leucyl-tRNA synthetase